MYQVDYEEKVETRYRTVTETYTDEDGNEYTESHEEPYEYRKLIVTLNKRKWIASLEKFLEIIQII